MPESPTSAPKDAVTLATEKQVAQLESEKAQILRSREKADARLAVIETQLSALKK